MVEQKTGQLEELISALQKGTENDRFVAISNLEKLGDIRAIETLVETFQNKAEKNLVRAHAVVAFGHLGKGDAATFKIVEIALKDDVPVVRAYAISALASWGNERAVDLILNALKNDVWRVRWTAALILGRIGNRRAVEPLIQALKDRSRAVRLHAAGALGRIGDTRAFEPLLKALNDPEPLVRLRVAEALGHLGDERALEALKAIARSDTNPVLYGQSVSDAAKGSIRRIRQKQENLSVYLGQNNKNQVAQEHPSIVS